MPNNHVFATKNPLSLLLGGKKSFHARIILTLSLIAFLSSFSFITNSFFKISNASAETRTPASSNNPSLSLTLSGSTQINYQNTTVTEKSATTNINVKTDNETGYVVNFSNQATDTTLYNSDTSSTSKITSILSDTTTLPSNTYGWSLDNTTFQPIPAISQPKDIIKTEDPTDTSGENHNLYIKTKVSNSLDAGTYSTNLTFSVITNNAPTRSEFMENFSSALKQYRISNNITTLPTTFKRSKIAPGAHLSTFIASSPTSISEIKVWIDQISRTCYWYTSADIASFNSNSTGFFGNDENFIELIDLDLKDLDAKNISLASNMFSSTKITHLDLSKFKADKLTNMKRTFADNPNLEKLDLTTFNTTNVTDMSELFNGDEKLTDLNISTLDTQNVTSMKSMFRKIATQVLRLSHFKTSKVTDMSYMFQGAKTAFVTVYNFDTSNVLNMTHMFEGMTNLDNLTTACFDTSKVTDMSYMYANLPNISSLSYGPGKIYNLITHQVINKTASATNLSHMFYNMPNLELIRHDFGLGIIQEPSHLSPRQCESMIIGIPEKRMNIDTSNATDMSYMFSHMQKLQYLTIDFETFKTSNVTNMDHMFSDLNKLTCFSQLEWRCMDFEYEIPNNEHERLTKNRIFANMDTSNVTNMESMFENLESYNFIRELYYPDYQSYELIGPRNYRIGKVKNLIKLQFNAKKVTNMRRMFANTYNNQALDIGGMRIDTNSGHILDITEMFAMDEPNRSELLTIISTEPNCEGNEWGNWTSYTYIVSFNKQNISGQNVFKNNNKLFGAYPLPKDTIGNISNKDNYGPQTVHHYSDEDINDFSYASPYKPSDSLGKYNGYFSGITDDDNVCKFD